MDSTSVPEWRVIPGWPNYAVSSAGEVKRIGGAKRGVRIGLILKQTISNTGCFMVHLSEARVQRSLTVHRLVAAAFLGLCPPGYQVNHKDGNRLNNSLDNLEYLTRIENMKHAVQNGLTAWGIRNWSARLSEDQVRTIRQLWPNRGMSQQQIANQYGVRQDHVSRILSRQSWKQLNG